jgi:V/A-type H+-transporting ATPase subunit E
MKTLEKGQDKIKQICDILRDETLKPAQKKAEEIIQAAEHQRDQIIKEAKISAVKLHEAAKLAIEKERAVFEAALQQAAKQAIDALKETIEERFFNQELTTLIQSQGADAHLVANLITAIVKALEKEGLGADLTSIVPKTVTPEQVASLLLQSGLKELQKGPIEVGAFAAGAQVKLKGKNLTIDLSDEALKELLATYIARKDFRNKLFL